MQNACLSRQSRSGDTSHRTHTHTHNGVVVHLRRVLASAVNSALNHMDAGFSEKKTGGNTAPRGVSSFRKDIAFLSAESQGRILKDLRRCVSSSAIQFFSDCDEDALLLNVVPTIAPPYKSLTVASNQSASHVCHQTEPIRISNPCSVVCG